MYPLTLILSLLPISLAAPIATTNNSHPVATTNDAQPILPAFYAPSSSSSSSTSPPLSSFDNTIAPGAVALNLDFNLPRLTEVETDADAGGESDIGNDAVAIASGLVGGGSGSSALNNVTQGSTSSFCGLLACVSAAQSDGSVSTSVSSAPIVSIGNATNLNIVGPLVVITVNQTGGGQESGDDDDNDDDDMDGDSDDLGGKE